MHGHGYPQPVKQPPPTGWLVFLRVLFVAISVLTIGLLAWTMLLRLAIVTRKALDWGLFVAAMAADALALVLIGTEPGDEIHTAGGWTGMALLFGTLVAVMAYYLAADVRHFHQLRYGTGYAPQPAPGYGYPQSPATPYTATTVPQTARQPIVPQPHHTPPPMPPTPTPIPTPPAQTPAPAPTPPPHTPAPARIDQVRAELDELSDYLRRHDGNGNGNHEGTR
ncbi:hypothetical protein [Streptomyces sp. CL12-4]|uniref:hypothetical protein n=1 Tax=Streptomyces sp. CL12-4 TaxID=2810306 RepID=UPI001EFA832C|nr:hypothetical protein [Streptomyces sp. CL12-4]MCG8967114.1 hypothetical protein [Streptomyces sp. CL12-4]